MYCLIMIMGCILWVTVNLKLAVFMKMHVSFCLRKVQACSLFVPVSYNELGRKKINSKDTQGIR